MNLYELCIQVDFIFPNGGIPYTSASSPDKPRYHVWDLQEHRYVLFESEDDMLRAIIDRHLRIVERLKHLRGEKIWELFCS